MCESMEGAGKIGREVTQRWKECQLSNTTTKGVWLSKLPLWELRDSPNGEVWEMG